MTQAQYEARVNVVFSFAAGIGVGLVMAAWMAVGR